MDLDRINTGTLPNDGTGDTDRAAFQKADAAIGAVNTHLRDQSNPHKVTAAQVGSLTAGQISTAIANAVTAASAGLVQSIVTDGSGHLILVFKDNSTKDLGSLIGPQGPGYSGATVNGAGRLILTLTGGGTVDAGSVIGPTGAPGAVFRTGSGAPSNGLGIDGDLYLNLSATSGTGDLYQRSGGTYSLTGNLRGPPGTGTVTSSGAPTSGQLATFTTATNIAGVTALPAANFPALTGDLTTTAGSLATTLAASGVTATAYTGLHSATFDAKGRATAAANVALTGDVTTTAGSLATIIAAGVVTFAKLATAAVGSAAELFSNAASKLVSVATLWATQTFVTLTDAATIAVDMSTFLNAKVTLAGNRTLGAPTNAKEGQSGIIQIIQDATGSRTLSYAAAWDFGSAGTPTLSTAAGKIDTISYVVINTSGPVVRAYFGKSA